MLLVQEAHFEHHCLRTATVTCRQHTSASCAALNSDWVGLGWSLGFCIYKSYQVRLLLLLLLHRPHFGKQGSEECLTLYSSTVLPNQDAGRLAEANRAGEGSAGLTSRSQYQRGGDNGVLRWQVGTTLRAARYWEWWARAHRVRTRDRKRKKNWKNYHCLRELWNYITKDLTFVPSEPLMKMRKILKDVMA